MILQICSDYASLPNLEDMTIERIKFFYIPLIGNLVEAQKKLRK